MEQNYLIIISFVVIIFLVIIGWIFNYLGKIAFKEETSGKPKSLGLLFSRSNFFRIIIVLAIIFALLVIVILNKYNETILTLLSTLAGVSLGGMVISQEDQSGTTKLKHKSILQCITSFQNIKLIYTRDKSDPVKRVIKSLKINLDDGQKIIIKNLCNIELIEAEDESQFEDDFEE